jgi:hypothetical protein
MVIADISLNLVRKTPPRTDETEIGIRSCGIRSFAAAYAKRTGERQDMVDVLPGFRPKPAEAGDRARHGLE